MKIRNTLLWAAMLALVQPCIANARQIYQLHWQGNVYTHGVGGKVVKTRYTERDIIRKCARDNGITDVNSLIYVYVVEEQNTEVVFAATGGTVCEVFQFEYSHTDVSNSDASHTVRQAFIFNEAHDSAIGSVLGSETARRTATGGLTEFNYHGSFQFALPEADAVYSGTFVTGKRIKDRVNP